MNQKKAKNVLGTELEVCSMDPVTGFYRDGCCNTGGSDMGLHTVCTEVTAEFLAFSKQQGNDLSTPHPQYEFPGLQPGRPLVPVRRTLEGSFRSRYGTACQTGSLSHFDP